MAGLADDSSTWLLERQLTPKFKRMGTMKEGCGGITEQIPFQGLAPEDIRASRTSLPGSWAAMRPGPTSFASASTPRHDRSNRADSRAQCPRCTSSTRPATELCCPSSLQAFRLRFAVADS